MPTTKEIEKEEQFALSSGDLTIRSVGGDGHLTTSVIYLNDQMIKNGEGEVGVTATAEPGDEVYIHVTINKPTGSDYASVTIHLRDDDSEEIWPYSSAEPDYDEVIYKITITLN